MVTTSSRPQNRTVKSTSKNYSPTFMGLSTDNKPTTTGENSLFWELDTGKLYYFSEGAWVEYTGSGSVGIQML